MMSHKKAISDGINNFFTNIGAMLAKKIEHCHNTIFSDFMSNIVQNSLFLESVIDGRNLKQIVQILKSCGYDGINVPLVKSLLSSTNIIQPLNYICKKSFKFCIFPNEMKIAKIVPLFKNVNHKEFYNYRPVSILPYFSNILDFFITN